MRLNSKNNKKLFQKTVKQKTLAKLI